MRFIEIDEKAKVKKEIAKDKIYDPSSEVIHEVESISWRGCIKPVISEVVPSVNGRKRYEELQLLKVVINSRDNLYSLAKALYRAIKYPCVVEYQMGDATCIGADKFNAGLIDQSKNIMSGLYFSHWIRQDYMSKDATRMIVRVNEALSAGGEIASIVQNVCNAIGDYRLSGTSRAHVDRLRSELIGSKPSSFRKIVEKICVPVKYYPGSSFKSKKERYEKRSGKGYRIIYDYEELWYCFMACEETRRIIENKRIRNMEDLIYSLEIDVDDNGW